jgi:glycosylphosphatidylinositol deacylase
VVIILMSVFQAKDGDWFIMATNLAPCVGVRVHLWPGNAVSGGLLDFEIAVEVTTKMAEVPAGPTQRQVYSLISNLIL